MMTAPLSLAWARYWALHVRQGTSVSDRASGAAGREADGWCLLPSGQVRRWKRRGKQAWRGGQFARHVRDSKSSGEKPVQNNASVKQVHSSRLSGAFVCGEGLGLAQVSNQNMRAPPPQPSLYNWRGGQPVSRRQMWRQSIC
ncbi:hypothetical protein K491DRAFT_38142 [Lophiostoma macrostomum CBS 122681]|uniref:Uncharacterized protein n=1 Tax=Lophiostoma macrostomum CBS 122681 TaxID=1314788 RepID=A0A6A6TN55_9PLEO|nr:hypothetical protein K491DRAFT_38142 [Lophiostoma macrostomum CBS 122681]